MKELTIYFLEDAPRAEFDIWFSEPYGERYESSTTVDFLDYVIRHYLNVKQMYIVNQDLKFNFRCAPPDEYNEFADSLWAIEKLFIDLVIVVQGE